ncbi:hypothetical protein PMAYCL1PPCAC_25740, partial [Pristionchus mayeri]
IIYSSFIVCTDSGFTGRKGNRRRLTSIGQALDHFRLHEWACVENTREGVRVAKVAAIAKAESRILCVYFAQWKSRFLPDILTRRYAA